MKPALLLAVAASLLIAGCGGDVEGEPSSTLTVTSTIPPATAEGRVYWLREGRVWPAARALETPGVAGAAISALFAGPTDEEEADLRFDTAIPTEVEPPEVAIEDGVAKVELDEQLSEAARAQIVYTLTQFPTVESVEIDGEMYTRADFEDLTPQILVESPLSSETVTSPLRVTGTANTFEATFNYELTDTDGRIVDENFVTATSGTGTRGTFDFTTDPFTVPFDGVGSLIVFELSAKDGSRINLVEIPLRMAR